MDFSTFMHRVDIRRKWPWLEYIPLLLTFAGLTFFIYQSYITINNFYKANLIKAFLRLFYSGTSSQQLFGFNDEATHLASEFYADGIILIEISFLLCIVGLFIHNRKKSLLTLGIFLNIITFVISFDATSSIAYKPVIYLYPAKTVEALVQLDIKGKFDTTYPQYDENIKGWKVTAHPDGSLINRNDGKEYSYLFWDAKLDEASFDLSKGFVVKGEDSAQFLQDTLGQMGLTPKEYNEFIVYWLPQMKNNKYNLIHFADKEYTDSAKLNISPKPDSLLRVFMVFKPLSDNIEIQPQEIKTFNRKGFTVVEWGGTMVK